MGLKRWTLSVAACSALAIALVAQGSVLAAPAAAPKSVAQPKWWKEAVVYQVYPRSFKDSDGDGIGDLNGVTEKLDYLKSLGVDVIWLSPHFDSPNVDNGYDIRDYRKVMAEFGTMADFDRMLAQMKKRHMRLIIDLVVNHTSDEHKWFAEAAKGPDNPYRDYYIWRDGKPAGQGGGPPNNYTSFFGGSAWEQAKPGGQYYLHYFAKQQPDLNWDNPKVRDDVYDVMRFWLDKGVSGFRMDVIPFISKDPAFPDLTLEQAKHPDVVYADGPNLHRYLKDMNRQVLSKYDTMTVGEAVGVSLAQSPKFTSASAGELNMIFHFDAVNIDRDGWRIKSWTLPELKAVYTRLDQSAGTDGWNTSFLTNHDKPRAVSHFGDDRPEWRGVSAKALATMMLTLRGTPFIYQGDELGMTNYPFKTIADYEDISARNLWKGQVESGKVPAAVVLDHLSRTSRDNSRTPMQWSSAVQGGFTTGKPWLAVNPNYATINAAQEVADQASVYQHYQRLLALRRKAPALVYGDYLDVDPGAEKVFAYTRTLGAERYLVLINFAETPLDYALPAGLRIKAMVLDNGAQGGAPGAGADKVVLQPWQATIYKLAAGG